MPNSRGSCAAQRVVLQIGAVGDPDFGDFMRLGDVDPFESGGIVYFTGAKDARSGLVGRHRYSLHNTAHLKNGQIQSAYYHQNQADIKPGKHRRYTQTCVPERPDHPDQTHKKRQQ